MADDKKYGLATRQELNRLLEDRKNDPPAPALDHPKPNWVLDSEDPKRRHIRMRERRIRHLMDRLHKSKNKLEHDFEQSR